MGRLRNLRRSRVKPPPEGLERDPEPVRELVPRKPLRLPGGLHRCKCGRNSFARSLTHLLAVPSRREPSPTRLRLQAGTVSIRLTVPSSAAPPQAAAAGARC